MSLNKTNTNPMLLRLSKSINHALRPICPKGTLRGHLWAAADRFQRSWGHRGFWQAVGMFWDHRIRPKFKRYPAIPDNVFLAKQVRVHEHIIQAHTANVDIIVCVHNALPDVQACLSSIIQNTRPPYRLILVDDGSDSETETFLKTWAPEQNAQLIRHEQAKGYTCAANAGLKAATSDMAILLNSDTIVTPLWLDRMVACAESDKNIGMVGPLSNAASWQSVPDIFDDEGDWNENHLADGCDLATQALLVGRCAQPCYPRIPFLNGFCLLIKRATIERVGYFDEDHFGRGYGEENDYAVRVRKSGMSLAVADDAYVWHTQSRSYSHDRRKKLAEEAQQKLNKLHGEATFTEGCGFCIADRTINSIRARNRVAWDRHSCIQAGLIRHEGRRVLFVLPTGRPGGGSHVIVQEARAMQKMGVDVRMFNFSANKEEFSAAYPEITIPVFYGSGLDDLTEVLPQFDAVIATLCTSVSWIDPKTTGAPDTVRGYYIQDYEPWFFDPSHHDYNEAIESYNKFPSLVLLTKTEWNQQTVEKETGAKPIVIGSSVDTDLFSPRQVQSTPDKLNIITMIRPETERRNPERTMRVLNELHHKYGSAISITLFGCETNAPLCKKWKGKFPFTHRGLITRTELAALLPEMDIFLDFSSYQAMGLTAMEAMASGTAVIVPKEGGASSFSRNGHNALAVDTSSDEACIEGVDRLIKDPDLLHTLRANALRDIQTYYPETVALNLLDALFDGKKMRTHTN